MLVMRHKEEIIDLNKMLEDVKHDQSKQFKQFDALAKKFENEKLYLVEDLKSKHRLEIENLKQSFNSNKDSFNEERRALMQEHEAEMAKLRQEIDAVTAGASKDKAEHEQNMLKLKKFHEKELEASKNNSTSEYVKLIDGLKLDLEALNKQKAASEHELKERYTKKIEEIVAKEEQIDLLKKSLDESKSSAAELKAKTDELNKQVWDYHNFFFIRFQRK
jgi:hypothetical protein